MAKVESSQSENNGADDTSTLTRSIVKCLAFLALKADKDISGKDLLTRVRFLEVQLGLGREDAASVLGSTTESIRVALYNARKKTQKGGRRGGSR